MLMSGRVGSLLSSLIAPFQAGLTRVTLGLMAVVIMLGLAWAPAQAVQITGNYTSDSQAIVTALRASLADPTDESATTEAKDAISTFYSRYHGRRYEKLQSYNTFRTVFNTLASNYRSPRPLRPAAAERVLTQLDRIERDLGRGN